MKIVKERIPPFAIGLVIGTFLAIALVSNWSKKREENGIPYPVTAVHEALGANHDWLNAFRPVRADELTGRILLLNFWTYSNIGSRLAFPDLARLHAEFGSDLYIIGIHSPKFTSEKDSQNISAAMQRYGIHEFVINDADFKLWSLFGVRSWPTQILVNPAGHIAGNFPGEGNFESIRAAIRQVKTQFPQKLNATPLPYEILMGEAKRMGSPLRYPTKLCYGEGLLWVSDSQNNRIVGIDLKSAKIQVSIGSRRPGLRDGDYAHAEFQSPEGLLYRQGKIWVADSMNHAIREIDLRAKKVKTIAGTGQNGSVRIAKHILALETPLSSPFDLAFWNGGKQLAIAMAGANQIWFYDFASKTLTVAAGTGKEAIEDGAYPQNSLAQPSGLFESRNALYFVDADSSSLRKLDHKNNVKTIIGTDLLTFGFIDGRKESALMQYPSAVWVDSNAIYVTDAFNHAVRRIDGQKFSVSTLAGKSGRGYQDGTGKEAKFFEPSDIKKIDGLFYVADSNNHAIRVVDPRFGDTSTLAVEEPENAASRGLANYLPMLRPAPDILLHAGLDIPVEIAFTEIWKLNGEAPSRLRFFEDDRKNGRLLLELNRDDLAKKSFVLPPLVSGKRYRLQATFYICREANEKYCAIESRDQGIEANHESEENRIRLLIGPYQ